MSPGRMVAIVLFPIWIVLAWWAALSIMKSCSEPDPWHEMRQSECSDWTGDLPAWCDQ